MITYGQNDLPWYLLWFTYVGIIYYRRRCPSHWLHLNAWRLLNFTKSAWRLLNLTCGTITKHQNKNKAKMPTNQSINNSPMLTTNHYPLIFIGYNLCDYTKYNIQRVTGPLILLQTCILFSSSSSGDSEELFEILSFNGTLLSSNFSKRRCICWQIFESSVGVDNGTLEVKVHLLIFIFFHLL